ncbi:MAG: cyclic nucleotide-binding domain-containing protein [Bdellovibrionales bacterium]|nr:cyclic nucleotide-binding domain-containing protein [Bdellovibrionales bacterium]
MNPQMRNFQKGDHLFREGEKAMFVYLIQKGAVTSYLQRPKQTIELAHLTPNHLAGEQSLFGSPTYNSSAVASADVVALELPIELVKAQLEVSSQAVKLVSKALIERLKALSQEIKSFRMERDTSPCPPEGTPKAFASLFHTVNHLGKKNADGSITADWRGTRTYAQKVFLEHPKRLENAMMIFVKMGIATLEMGQPEDDPKAPEELLRVHFRTLIPIEQFFEFYQHFYYKPGGQGQLKFDEMCYTVVKSILKFAEGQTPDRHQSVAVNFSEVQEYVKEEFSLPFNNDTLGVLEQRGVFFKRMTGASGHAALAFHLGDLKTLFMNWSVLLEVDRWNERGQVLLEEPKQKNKKVSASCPSCQGEIQMTQKFCGQCGYKLQAAA